MDAVTDGLRRALRDHPDVVFAYLFGSRAAGSTHSRADVDVAVWLDPNLPRVPYLGLHLALRDAVGRDDVDLVVLNDAPPALAHVAIGGVLLVSRDEGRRADAEARIMARYRDRLPALAAHTEAFAQRLRERGLG